MIALAAPSHRRPCRSCRVPGVTSTTGSLYTAPAQPASFPIGPFAAMVFTWGLLGFSVWAIATGRYKSWPVVGTKDAIPDLGV
jgi:hypothetical protein